MVTSEFLFYLFTNESHTRITIKAWFTFRSASLIWLHVSYERKNFNKRSVSTKLYTRYHVVRSIREYETIYAYTRHTRKNFPSLNKKDFSLPLPFFSFFHFYVQYSRSFSTSVWDITCFGTKRDSEKRIRKKSKLTTHGCFHITKV